MKNEMNTISRMQFAKSFTFECDAYFSHLNWHGLTPSLNQKNNRHYLANAAVTIQQYKAV